MTGLHTAGNAVPTIDDTELGDALDHLACIDPAVDLHADALRLTATERHTRDHTQTLVAAYAAYEDGSILTTLAHTLQRLSHPDTNPCLRDLPLDQQKNAQLLGERLAAALTDPDIQQLAADLAAAIDGN